MDFQESIRLLLGHERDAMEVDDDDDGNDDISMGAVAAAAAASNRRGSRKIVSKMIDRLRSEQKANVSDDDDNKNVTEEEDDDDDDDDDDGGDDDDESEEDTSFLKKRQSTRRSSSGVQSGTASNKPHNLRSLLGNLSLDEISHFSNYLTDRMTERLDIEALLPATQDEDANAAAMDGPAAQKLPRHALQAAQLLVHLLQRPGGWGAGLVQASALTALTALLKRWRVEIQDTVAGKTTKKKNSASTNQSKQTTRRTRKSRQKSVAFQDHASYSDEDEHENDAALHVESEDEGTDCYAKLTPHDLLLLGLDLSLEVARLPRHPEFLGWSSECREAVIEAVASVLGTTAAITTPSKRSAVDPSANLLADAALREAKKSLAECLAVDLHDDGDDDSGDHAAETSSSPTLSSPTTTSTGKLSNLHETTVCICRGLYPMLTWKEVLPFGEAGKQSASAAAWDVLENLILELSENPAIQRSRVLSPRIANSLSHTDANMMSPGRSTPTLSNVTPKPNRRVRLSDSAQNENLSITSPKLKSTARKPAPFLTAAKNKSRPIFSAMLGLLQKVLTDSSMEKASVRNSAIEPIQKCGGHLHYRERHHFLQFLIQACHSRISVHRLVACEVIGRTLSEVWLWSEHAGRFVPSPTHSTRSRKSLSPLVISSEQDMPAALFGAMQGRLSDRVPTVRASSILALSCVLKAAREAQAKSGAASICSTGLSETLAADIDDLLEVLRVRATVDAKATVRRHAVAALGEIFLWSSAELTDHDLALLRDRCQDSSTMTRKAAAESLTALLEHGNSHMDEAIQHTWISAVLPLCLDSDGSSGTSCIGFTQRLMLLPLLEEGQGPAANKSWSMLAKVGDGAGRQGSSRGELEALKLAICKMLEDSTESSRIKVEFMDIIHHTAISTLESDGFDDNVEQRRTGVWCLFDAFVRSFKDTSSLLQLFGRKSVDVSFLAMAWDKLLMLSTKSDLDSRCRQRLRGCVRRALYVLAAASRALDQAAVGEAKSRLQHMICNFDLPEDVLGSAIAALSSMTLALSPLGDVTSAHTEGYRWISDSFTSCERKLADAVGSHVSPEQIITVSRALFTVGECSMVGFNSNDDGTVSKREASTLSAKDFQTKGMIGLHVKPSSALLDLVMSFLSSSVPGTAGVPLPESVRAYAFLSLGKMCLRDINLAKQTLTVLARELHENMSTGSSVVQCNVLLIMGDLCIKYTSLADRYLPVMAACLQSGSVDLSSNVLGTQGGSGFDVVRKSAVILLSSLIMQDYIKWRGLLFHRFLVAAADDYDEVSQLASSTLAGPLLIKTPKLFFNHFVESFFVLNRCTAHPMYIAAASTGDGGSGIAVGFDGIDLSGAAGRLRRTRMYELMLSKMTDEEKIGVTAKIAKEILGSALIEGSDLFRACGKPTDAISDSSAYLVLSDALAVLRSENIRVGKKLTNESEDIDDPNIDGTVKRVVQAKTRLLTKISRKQLVEIVVPILCNLKALLQKNCSPLLKDVMAYMVDVYTSYKKEVQDVLVSDPTLLQEIEYDARQYKRDFKSLEASRLTAVAP